MAEISSKTVTNMECSQALKAQNLYTHRMWHLRKALLDFQSDPFV